MRSVLVREVFIDCTTLRFQHSAIYQNTRFIASYIPSRGGGRRNESEHKSNLINYQTIRFDTFILLYPNDEAQLRHFLRTSQPLKGLDREYFEKIMTY